MLLSNVKSQYHSLFLANIFKIVNGPEVLDKYVGEAERNIRLLFREAEEEWEMSRSNSALHVIIFDE